MDRLLHIKKTKWLLVFILQGVVEARNDVFDQQGLTAETHYIASTGIGGATSVREKYQEALKMAVEMAKNKADAMAEAAGMTVVKAVNISEDGYYPQARYNTAGASAKQMMMEDAAADMGVMPGEVSIEAQVSVTFEME